MYEQKFAIYFKQCSGKGAGGVLTLKILQTHLLTNTSHSHSQSNNYSKTNVVHTNLIMLLFISCNWRHLTEDSFFALANYKCARLKWFHNDYFSIIYIRDMLSVWLQELKCHLIGFSFLFIEGNSLNRL